MTFVQPQNGILMSSQYVGGYRFFTGRTEEPVDVSSPPYVVPFTVAILAAQSIFLEEYYSPSTTLIIPIIRTNIPYGHLFIISMAFVTALMVKWSFATNPPYMPLLGSYQSLPDFEALRQIASMSLPPKITKPKPDDEVPSTPLFPQGITINLSFLAPFSSPTSRAATLFSLKLTLIKGTPGYIIPLITLIIYFVLKPFLENNNKQANKKNN